MGHSGTAHLLQSYSQNNCVFPLKYDIIFIHKTAIQCHFMESLLSKKYLYRLEKQNVI